MFFPCCLTGSPVPFLFDRLEQLAAHYLRKSGSTEVTPIE